MKTHALRNHLWAVALGGALLGSGCATPLANVPVKDQVNHLTVSQLLAQYPEIQRLNRSPFSPSGGTIWNMPHVRPLVAAWGKPDERPFSFWNFMPFGAIPPFHPTSHYVWHFRTKSATALIDHPVVYGWQPHVWTLRWEEHSPAP